MVLLCYYCAKELFGNLQLLPLSVDSYRARIIKLQCALFALALRSPSRVFEISESGERRARAFASYQALRNFRKPLLTRLSGPGATRVGSIHDRRIVGNTITM